MRWISMILVLALLLSACGKPAGLGNGALQEAVDEAPNASLENATSEKPVQQEEPAEEPEGVVEEKAVQEPEDEGFVKEGEDRIDITLNNGEGTIEGTVDGVTKSTTSPYEDIDALIFDAAELFDMSLFETRYIVWVDGNRYLRPSQEKEAEEAISKLEDPILDTSGIAYHVTKDTGWIRGIGCSRDRGILTLKIHNEADEPVPIWRDVKPRIKRALVFRFNKAVLDTMYCESKEVLEANTTYKCRKSALTFVEDKKTSNINDNVDYGDLKNQVVVQRPGMTEIMEFNCPLHALNATSAPTNNTLNESNTSNESTNSTA